jgi:hypothetical protein
MDRLQEFEQLCIQHHDLLWEEYDAAAANKIYKKIEKLAVDMYKDGVHHQLELLFMHEHYNVRFLAASHSLLKNEKKAIAALDALYEEADPHYSRNAMHTLMAWKQGKMQDYQTALFEGD